VLDDLALGAMEAGVAEDAAEGVEERVGSGHRRIIADRCGPLQRVSAESRSIRVPVASALPLRHPGRPPARSDTLSHSFAQLILIGLWTAQARAAVIPVIQNTSVNYSGNTLVLKGRNFGSNPTIVLDNQALATLSASGTPFVAKLRVEAPGEGAAVNPLQAALLKRTLSIGVARKVVGVGSVGTRCWVILLLGNDANDPLFLQVKEAQS
jgi:hypothetical protein